MNVRSWICVFLLFCASHSVAQAPTEKLDALPPKAPQEELRRQINANLFIDERGVRAAELAQRLVSLERLSSDKDPKPLADALELAVIAYYCAEDAINMVACGKEAISIHEKLNPKNPWQAGRIALDVATKICLLRKPVELRREYSRLATTQWYEINDLINQKDIGTATQQVDSAMARIQFIMNECDVPFDQLDVTGDYVRLRASIARAEGKLPRAIEMSELAMSIYKKGNGSKYGTRQYITEADLGGMQIDSNNFDAAERHLRSAVDIAAEVMPIDSFDRANSIAQLANLLVAKGDRGRGKDLAREASALVRASRTLTPVERAKIMTPIANIHIRTNDNDEAIAVCNEIMTILKKEKMNESYNYVQAELNLGHGYLQKGEFAKAKEVYANSLALSTKRNYQESVVSSTIAMARLAVKESDFDTAESYFQKAMDQSRRLWGENSFNITELRQDLANVSFQRIRTAYQARNFNAVRQACLKREEFLRSFKDSEYFTVRLCSLDLEWLDRVSKLVPNDYADWLTARRIADIPYDEIDPKPTMKDRISQVESSIAVFERLFGQDYYLIPILKGELGDIYFLGNETAKAEPILVDAIASLEKGWPAEHPHYFLPSSYYDLGKILVSREVDIPRGINCLESAAIMYRGLYGASYNYADCLRELAQARFWKGDYTRAEANAVELIDVQSRLKGRESIAIIPARRILGRIRIAQGDGKGSVEQLTEVVRLGKQLKIATNIQAQDLEFLAESQLLLGDQATAENLFKQSMAMYTEAEQKANWMYGLANANLGGLYLKQGKVDEAKECLERAAANYESFPNFNLGYRRGVRNRLAQIELDGAAVKESALDPVAANPHRIAALDHLKRLPDTPRWQIGLQEQYIKSNEKWGSLSGEARTKVDAAVKQFDEAVRLAQAKNYEGAIQLYPSILEVFSKELGSEDIRWAFAERNRSSVLYQLDRWPDSREAAQAAVNVFDKTVAPNNFQSGDLLLLIGNTWRCRGEPSKAIPFYARAYQMFFAIEPGGVMMTIAMFRHAQCRMAEDQLQGAYSDLGVATRNLRVYSQSELTLFIEALATSSELSARLGDFDWGKIQADEAMEIVKARKLEGTEAELAAHRGLTKLFLEWNKPAEAETHARQWLELSKKLFAEKDGEATEALLALALANLEKDDLTSAEAFANQALGRAERSPGVEIASSAQARMILGEIGYKRGNWSAAQTDTLSALDEFEKKAGPSHRRTIRTLDLLARLQLNQGHLSEGAKTRGRILAIEIEGLDRVSRVATGDQLIELANRAREALYAYLALPEREQAAELAYNGLLRLKGAAFTRQQQLRIAASDPTRKNLAHQWRSVGSEIATEALNPPYQEGKRVWFQSLATKMETLNNLESQLAAGTEPAKPVTAKEISDALPVDAVLVDYLIYPFVKSDSAKGENSKAELRYAAFVLKKGKPPLRFDLPEAEVIAQSVTDWRKSIEGFGQLKFEDRYSKGVPEARDILSRVSRAAWDPIREAVSDSRVIYLSPDGPLAAIPFAALPGTSPDRFLIEEKSILVVPAARMLVDAKPTQNSEPSLMVVGQVDYGAAPGNVASTSSKRRLGGFTKLTEDHLECGAVNKRFEAAYPKAKRLYITGADPTEDAIRRMIGGYHWVHISTHGFFIEENVMMSLGQQFSLSGIGEVNLPGIAGENYSMHVLSHPGLQCGIGMAGANAVIKPGQDDGVLTAFEVSMLDLSGIDTLMLSACQTALGSSRNGEGVLGLQRAFHQAGVHSVIATLWSVPVAETNVFVDFFYGHLWNDHLRQADALQATQIEFIEYAREVISKKGDRVDRIHPYYWAGFSISGDGK